MISRPCFSRQGIRFLLGLPPQAAGRKYSHERRLCLNPWRNKNAATLEVRGYWKSPFMRKSTTIYCGMNCKDSKYIVVNFCIWLLFQCPRSYGIPASPRRFELPTPRLGVKRAVSTQVQPNPCGISKSNKINTFEPFISTWKHLRPPRSGMIFLIVLAKY